jgi:hypothetical protein
MDRVAIQNALRLARKHGYADGGTPDEPMPAPMPMVGAPSVEETVNLAQKTLSTPPRRFDINSPEAGSTGPESKPSLENINFLKNILDQTIERHFSSPENKREDQPSMEEEEFETIHPAMRIPGVHIRTAEAGEPIFRGDD